MYDLEAELQKQIDLYLKNISERVTKLMTDAIQQSIYDEYSPTTYKRTYTFLNSVNAHINPDGNIFVYVDINEGTQYYSVVDGSSQYMNISNYLEGGHSDSTGINNEYHNYGARNYLEKAEELIHNEFKELNIEIIK